MTTGSADDGTPRDAGDEAEGEVEIVLLEAPPARSLAAQRTDFGRLDVEAYARLRSRLAQEGHDRAALLAEAALDEASWERIDEAWQAELSRQIDAAGEGVPALVSRYSQVFARTQRDAPGKSLTLEEFAACTRALKHARDPQRALKRLGTNLTEYLKANQQWSPKLSQDSALAQRFRQLLG